MAIYFCQKIRIDFKKVTGLYFTKSKGCEIWDLNKKKYYDLSLMGVGTNILGYANSRVDKEVKNVIKNGNLTTLNCPEEVFSSEKISFSTSMGKHG